ncbi:MAG: hypothetical protein HN344_05820 [Gammaproteobacteria bacterium]|jgi:hypothetical protein|nr:hypothetical protein [Gammaproteobacteria bacterium]
MSVTFWIPEAGKIEKSEPCDCDSDPHCYFCKGTGVYKYSDSAAPSLNLANVNARNILSLLGFAPEDRECGGTTEVAPLRQQIMRLRNVTRTRQPALRVASESGGEGTGQCQCIEQGYTDEQVLDRLARLDTVLTYAQENEMEVVWA